MTVARSASELIRYHDKVIVIDRRTLYVLSFNFTHLDIDRSRGFGIVTRQRRNGWRKASSFWRRTRNANSVLLRIGYFCCQSGQCPEGARQFSQAGPQTAFDLRSENIGQGDDCASCRIAPRPELRSGSSGKPRPICRSERLAKSSPAHSDDHSRRTPGVHRQPELARRGAGFCVARSASSFAMRKSSRSSWKRLNRTGPLERRKKESSADTNEAETPKKEADKAVKILIEELHPIATTVKKAVQESGGASGRGGARRRKRAGNRERVVKKVVKQAVKEAIKA